MNIEKELQQLTRSEMISGIKTHITIARDDMNAAITADQIDMVEYYASIIVRLANEVMELEELTF